jgi:hypothetical protein
MMSWTLSTVKAIESLPNLCSNVPDFKKFLETKVLNKGNALAAQYQSLPDP